MKGQTGCSTNFLQLTPKEKLQAKQRKSDLAEIAQQRKEEELRRRISQIENDLPFHHK
jgi:type VI protein secretion system component VasA